MLVQLVWVKLSERASGSAQPNVVDGTGVRALFDRSREKRRTESDYGDGIIESDILSEGEDSNSELVPSELLTEEAAFAFAATAILGNGECAAEMTMGDTETPDGFAAAAAAVACSRILAVTGGGGGGGGGGADGPTDIAAGGLEDGVGDSDGSDAAAAAAAAAVRR